MNKQHKFSMTAVIFFASIFSGHGLTCYNCNPCSDPFVPENAGAKYCESNVCGNVTVSDPTRDGVKVVSRLCLEDIPESCHHLNDNLLESTENQSMVCHICNKKDFCNGPPCNQTSPCRHPLPIHPPEAHVYWMKAMIILLLVLIPTTLLVYKTKDKLMQLKHKIFKNNICSLDSISTKVIPSRNAALAFARKNHPAKKKLVMESIRNPNTLQVYNNEQQKSMTLTTTIDSGSYSRNETAIWTIPNHQDTSNDTAPTVCKIPYPPTPGNLNTMNNPTPLNNKTSCYDKNSAFIVTSGCTAANNKPQQSTSTMPHAKMTKINLFKSIVRKLYNKQQLALVKKAMENSEIRQESSKVGGDVMESVSQSKNSSLPVNNTQQNIASNKVICPTTTLNK